MLLVKSKELKNSNKQCPLKSILAGASSLCALLTSAPIYAQTLVSEDLPEATSGFSSAGSILSIFLSLLLVIAIIFALAYIMRRFNVAQAGNGQMKVVASMMAGQKEKIMVIEVGDQQFMLGVTAHNINHLATLDTPLQNTKANPSTSEQTSQLNFQQKLVQAMAANIPGSKVDKDGKMKASSSSFELNKNKVNNHE